MEHRINTFVELGGFRFKYKREAADFLKKKIYGLGECHIDKNHKDFNFFMEITKCRFDETNPYDHSNILKFIIHKRFKVQNVLHLQLVFKDGTVRSCSWRKCATQNTKKDSFGTKLNKVLRMSIRPQIKKYNKKSFCEHCKSTTKLTVDHHKIPFYKLKYNFLKKNKLPDGVEFSKDEYGTYFMKEPTNDFINKWFEYHEKYATYQTLCMLCNTKKYSLDRKRELSLQSINKKYKRLKNDKDHHINILTKKLNKIQLEINNLKKLKEIEQ